MPPQECIWLRRWGRDSNGRLLEVDVVAESLDRRHVLIGEVKWEEKQDIRRLVSELPRKASRLPFVGDRRVHYALWLKRPSQKREYQVSLFGPEETMDAC